MRRLAVLAVAITLFAGARAVAAGVHPQDGPHADLRVAIEDELVRYSVGINLAFLDEVLEVPRESLGALSDAEADRVLEAFREMLIARAPCSINGRDVEPVFERLDVFKDPDPGMIAIFENTGARGLIRATAVMRFDAPERTETVEVTWPAYPIDQLAERMETPGSVRPRMYFEAVFTAGGKAIPTKFTQAEPTVRWSRAAASEADPLSGLPSPVSSTRRAPMLAVVLGGVALAALGLAATRRTTRGRAVAVIGALIASGGTLVAFIGPSGRGVESDGTLVTGEEAERVLLALHESLYRAFDYTAESDIYDRLEFALAGDLLGELYEQIRLSLLQAEEAMKIGVVTGLTPIETTIREIDPSGADPVGLGFDAVHQWRVDGTVYHWGHSHTRSHIYEAAYRVTYTKSGWRITQHELRSQRRIEPEAGVHDEDNDATLRRMLEQLGRPDI